MPSSDGAAGYFDRDALQRHRQSAMKVFVVAVTGDVTPMRAWRCTLLLAVVIVLLAVAPAVCGDGSEATVPVGWLSQAMKRSLPLSYLDQPPEDEGIQGARLGIADDNTTGRFTGQTFALTEEVAPEDGDLAAAFRDLAAKGVRLIVTDVAAPELLAVAGL